MRVSRVLNLAAFILVLLFDVSRAEVLDSLIVIQPQEEVFFVNPSTFFLKDKTGQLSFEQIRAMPNRFQPLGTDHEFFDKDKFVAAFWGRASLQSKTEETLRYVLYFYPGIDTIELWVENPAGEIQKSKLSSITPTRQRPINVSQELCSPIFISPGITTIYFRIPNHSTWNRELASLIVNLAQQDVFTNYFLRSHQLNGFILGIISIMTVFHLVVFLLFRDRTYLLLVVNLFFTLLYLLLLKNYQMELLNTAFWLDVVRYVRNPAAVLMCLTSLLFTQSFLSTREVDPTMHKLLNYLVAFSSLVLICMISLQFLRTMELIGIYIGIGTFLLLVIASLRSFQKGNKLSLYILLGYASFFLVIFVFIFPLGYSDFRTNETDFHYYAEAFRAVVFAVGVANRFKTVQQNAIQLQLENSKLTLSKEFELQAERDRIRRDLHDSLGGQLSALSIGLGRLNDRHNFDSLADLQSISDKAIVELRDSLWLLDKNQVSVEELEQRVNSLFWQYRKSEVNAKLTASVANLEQIQLTSIVAGHLFRIIQESVQNAIKHSGANKIEVSLQDRGGRLIVKIEDDGCGFNWPSNQSQDNYGLRNMQKRAEQIGGTFSIKSSIGFGTCVSMEFNLSELKASQ